MFEGTGLERGRSRLVEVAWVLVRWMFFLTPLPWPNRIKAMLLRLFGAEVGVGVNIRPRVNIHFPWKLKLGNHCWIGDSCELLNLEPIVIEDNSALAHEVYLAAASHDIRSRSLRYANKPIVIRKGCWIATRAFIGPGVEIGEQSVVGACAVVVKSVPPYSVVTGPQAEVRMRREFERD